MSKPKDRFAYFDEFRDRRLDKFEVPRSQGAIEMAMRTAFMNGTYTGEAMARNQRRRARKGRR